MNEFASEADEAINLPAVVQPIDALKPRHERIIDFIVTHPEIPLGDVAVAFGTSPAWLSTLMRSDLFKSRLKERQDQVFNLEVTTMGDRIDALATKSLEKLLSRLDTEQDTAKINKTAEIALRACGYLKDKAPIPHTQTNVAIFGSVPKNTLAAARQLMSGRFTQIENLDPVQDVEVQAAAG